jgi:hypothetical protein
MQQAAAANPAATMLPTTTFLPQTTPPVGADSFSSGAGAQGPEADASQAGAAASTGGTTGAKPKFGGIPCLLMACCPCVIPVVAAGWVVTHAIGAAVGLGGMALAGLGAAGHGLAIALGTLVGLCP